MAWPIYREISSTGDTIFELDWLTNPFNVAWEVVVPTGTTVSYGVDTTLDPVNPTVGEGYGISVAPNPTWSSLQAAGTAAGSNGTITSPRRAMRVTVASISGGPIRVSILQPFSIN